MHCPDCGNLADDDDLFCIYCGTELHRQSHSNASHDIPFDEVRAPWMVKLDNAEKIIAELETQIQYVESVNAEFCEALTKYLNENNALKAQIAKLDEEINTAKRKITELNKDITLADLNNAREQVWELD